MCILVFRCTGLDATKSYAVCFISLFSKPQQGIPLVTNFTNFLVLTFSSWPLCKEHVPVCSWSLAPLYHNQFHLCRPSPTGLRGLSGGHGTWLINVKLQTVESSADLSALGLSWWDSSKAEALHSGQWRPSLWEVQACAQPVYNNNNNKKHLFIEVLLLE